MKRFVVTVVLLVLTFATAACTNMTAKHEVETMRQKIEELRQENIRPEQVMEQWDKSARKLAFFIRHYDLKEAKHAITELCSSDERKPMQYTIALMYLEALEHEERMTITNIL